jgi:small subunit ribosomal protein S1
MSTTETSQNSPDGADAPPGNEPAANEPAGNGSSSALGETRNGESGTPAPADAASAESASAGHGHETESEQGPASGEDAAESPSGDVAEASEAGPGAPHAEGQEKKRRRRRRKKKPGAHAAADGTASPESPEGVEGEQAPEGGAEAKGAVEKGERERGEKKDRKREKKHAGPPRERPPVTIGDIVFGKILEITEDAILIDIPGKAHAIFDRREMLLADDDDEQASRTAARAAEPEPHAEGAEASPETSAPAQPGEATATETEAVAAEPAAQEQPASEPATGEPAEAGEAPAVVETGAATLPATPVAVAVAELATPAEPAEQTEEEAATPAPAEPPREPKVPRVILEVGADFIGVVHNDGARGGLVVLTHHPRRADRARSHIEKAFNDKVTIEGLVTGVIKGGIEVDVEGLRAFAPGSHVDMRLGADLTYLLAKRLPFLVTQYAKRGRDVVLSRKAMIEEEARRARSEALAKLKVGEDLDGVVRSVVPFGAFVDVGGIEGLVPLQEMSHNRSDGPSDVFKAGEPTRVKVIKIDDKGKVWLSRKATIPDPWQEVARKYAHGTRHTGKVVRLQPFGAFVELEPGVDGLIHTSDLSIKRIESPEEVVKVGDAIEVVVSHVEASNHKIALHPAPQGAAADEAPQRVVPHKPVKAKVVNIESGGLVVRILGVTGRNARGYVTAAGTGTPRGTELRKAFSIGQEVEAKVIEMDPRRGEVKLSIKALSEDQERSAYQQYRQQLKAEAKFTFADLLAKKKN